MYKRDYMSCLICMYNKYTYVKPFMTLKIGLWNKELTRFYKCLNTCVYTGSYWPCVSWDV